MADNFRDEQNPEAGQSQTVDRQTQYPPAECSRCGGLPTIAMQATCVAKTKWGHTDLMSPRPGNSKRRESCKASRRSWVSRKYGTSGFVINAK